MIIPFLIFIISLFFLVLGADFFLRSAEKIGLAIGLSPFIVGVTIVAFGTSFPELFTSITAVFMGATEMVVANAVGSNIANILLVVGISAIVGGRLAMTKNLIDVELPLLAIGTVILMGVVYPWGEKEALITRTESIILLTTYLIYLFYTFTHKEEEVEQETLPTRKERRKHLTASEQLEKPRINAKDIVFLIGGGLALTLSARFLVSSVIEISAFLGIGVGVISILAVALGTSLPELVVSVKAAFQKKPEIALGNIFGSNVFNYFVVIGLPGVFTNINIDEKTLLIGFPIMILTTLLFVISGISRTIHNWEGFFYITLYVIFVGKILNIF
jgi:cation:H+ antiporter